MANQIVINGKLMKLIFCKYIRKGGKVIYPKNGNVFSFYVPA